MSQGKFSNPRPHRDEERQIEETFRQLTGRDSAKTTPPPIHEEPLAEAFDKPFEDSFGDIFETEAKPVRGAYEKPDPKAFDLRFDEEDFFDDEPEKAPDDFLDKAMAFINENKKLVLAFLCAAALLLIVVVIAVFFFSGSDPNDGKILDNVCIADIDVGGLTKSEAISVVKQATSRTYGYQDMVIDLSGTELRLSPEDTGAELDVQAAVEAAYAYGRTGSDAEREQALHSSSSQPHIIAVLPYLELDEAYIRDTLTAYAEDTGSTLTQTSYGLEGSQPELDAEDFDENAPTQTLVITMGTPGIGFDANDVYERVLDAYSLHQFLVSVENVESVKDPDPIDLEEIYQEYYIAPVDAKVNMQTFETIPGRYGYDFDLAEARALVNEAQYGEVIRIPMQYIVPEILDEDMFFRDVLGSSQVSHTGSSDRDANLQLACQAINGLVLNPGEKFSFNDTVGQRGSANGYKSAPEVTGGNEAEIIGGGVGQVASGLYHSALLSDLEINYRVSQSFAPGYIANGLDAAVSSDSHDLQFTNSTGFPIRIEAEAATGQVSIRILGTDERDYYIKVESDTTATSAPNTEYIDFAFDNPEGYRDGDVIQVGVSGFTVKTYKLKYNKASGELMAKDFEANSHYESITEIVARVAPEPTTAPTTVPTVPPTEPLPTAPPADLPVTPPESTPATTPEPGSLTDPVPEDLELVG